MSKTFKALQRAAQEKARRLAEDKRERVPEAETRQEEHLPEPELAPAPPAPPRLNLEPPPPPRPAPPPRTDPPPAPRAENPPRKEIRPDPPPRPKPMAEILPAPEPTRQAAPEPELRPEPALASSEDPLPAEGIHPDPLLVGMLTEAFCAEGRPSPRIGEAGHVAGPQDARRAAELLRRHSLLHCVRLGDERWLWFWANRVQAQAYASEQGLLLDEAALR